MVSVRTVPGVHLCRVVNCNNCEEGEEMIAQGYAAERISGKWIWSVATRDEEGVFCHQGEATWKMRSNVWFFDTLDEVEKFCAEMNG